MDVSSNNDRLIPLPNATKTEPSEENFEHLFLDSPGLNNHNSGEPLCVFCLSPPFFIRGLSGEKRHEAPSRRKELPFSTSSFPGLSLGRINKKKSYANLLLTIADLFSNFKRRKSLNLEEILSTIQDAWKGPETITFCDSKSDVEMISKKLSVLEAPPPNPQRRRLSVPETIMRKHILAQESFNSQESKYYHWGNEAQCLSDPNLSKKKDSNLIRKSTLLRRLWGDHNKPKLLSGSFQEWQYSYKKGSSTQSLNSNHSSPEHMPKSMRETTSPHRKLSSGPNRFSAKKSCHDESSLNSPKRKMAIIDNASLKSLSKTHPSRESTTKYTYSSFTNFSDTNSDSAYTNSISNLTNVDSSSSKNSKNHYDNDLRSRSEAQSRRSTASFQETAVQTRDVANLNVISNVNLSQSTLDVIFKQVMKDVSKLTPGEINVSSAQVTCDDKDEIIIKTVPGVPLDTHSDKTRLSSDRSNIEQFIISNVRTGSPYTKPTENVQSAVPRFSAVPRTSSMEVNTSEEDKEDSDTPSFVDSLEDFSSPRALVESRRSSSDISQLLPEGKKCSSPKKSSTFYIPIEVAKDKEVKAVSDLLPLKVKERLIERQQKREEKCRQFKTASALKITDSVSEIKSNLNLKKYLPKKRTKPILPSIELLKKSSKDKKVSPVKVSSTGKRALRQSKAVEKRDEKINNVYHQVEKKDEFTIEPRKIYRRTTHENAHKRIEILEIMECIEITPEKGQKSKIPIPIGSTSSKKTSFDKPSYLDLDNYFPDQKLDQLIANILIDSLNHDVNNSNYKNDKKNENVLQHAIPENDGKYIQKFDAIPEETPILRRHPEEKNNNNQESSKDTNANCTGSIKSKKLEKKDVSSIPKGWVTIYTVHKETETPETTSDEGKQYLDMNDVREVTHLSANVENQNSAKSNMSNSDSKQEQSTNNDQFLSSSNEDNAVVESTLVHRPVRKFGNYMKKAKMKGEEQQKSTQGGDWSVTVSGTNSYGQMAPDVEMRLKFPNKFVPFNQNYSGPLQPDSKPQERRYNFPKIENDRSMQEVEQKVQKHRIINEGLPKIQTAQSRNKKTDDSVVSVTPSIIMPRQTKTSRSRYHLSRPREGFSLPDVPPIINERQYYELLSRLNGILAITGRSISSEGKSVEER